MTFKMYFYINIIIYVFSLTIILNLRGQKLKSNIGSVFPKDIAMLNSFRAPQADPGVCLLFWSSFMNICIFSLFSFSILSSSSHFPPHRHKSQFDVVYGCLCCECISETSQTTKKIFLKELQLLPRTEISSSQFLLLSLPFQNSCIAPFSD